MRRWLTARPFAPALAVAALLWGAGMVVFLLVGPGLGAWADTLLTACFGWNAEARRYRLDALLLALLEPPLFVAVIALFYADELRAFVDGLRHHKIALEQRFVREGTHTAEGGEKAMRELLRATRTPTAVVCSNDWTAIGALHAIHQAGLSVPHDISLVGFDDIPLTSYTTPTLTTVRMSARDVGAAAFQALFNLIGEKHVEGDVYQVPTRLVVRESTARPRAK